MSTCPACNQTWTDVHVCQGFTFLKTPVPEPPRSLLTSIQYTIRTESVRVFIYDRLDRFRKRECNRVIDDFRHLLECRTCGLTCTGRQLMSFKMSPPPCFLDLTWWLEK